MENRFSECQELAELYKAKAAEGLIDVKFYVGNAGEAGLQIVCAEALRLEAAIKRGEAFPLVFGDLPKVA